MARYKPYDYNQLVMVPVSLEDQLVPGTLEYAIHHVIEERLDLSMFDKRFRNDETGRCAYDRKVLLKIVLFGYSRGLISSRSLERACVENVTFMALTCGQKPDHSTIAAFISSMGEQITPVFTQVLMTCEEEDLLGGTHFSLDGLKVSSNASKEWSGTFKDLKKKQEALNNKVKEAICEHREVDKRKERYKSKRRWFGPDDFKMDDRTGKLICPAGEGLYKNGTNFETEDGYLATSYRAPKRACTGCHLRSKCMRNPAGRSRQVRLFHGRRPGSLTDAMKQKIDTPEGRAKYSKRLGIVEPVFGNIRAQKRMDRFTLRGRPKVNIQWRLYCMVHNIEKILHFGTSFVMAA